MKVVVAAAITLSVLGACSGHGSGSSPRSSTATPLPPTATTATSTTLSAAQSAVNAQARREVAIISCGPNRLHHVEIKGTAHNTTAEVATYAVQLTVIDASGKHFYATAASAGRVAPAQEAEWVAETTAPYVAGM